MPEALTPNVPLLRRTLAHIETKPDTWEQSSWRSQCHAGCGTAYCFAGWAVVLHGGKFAVGDAGELADTVVPAGADPADRDQWRFVADYAAEILGIPGDECGDWMDLPELFESHNDLEDLRRIVAELCGEAS